MRERLFYIDILKALAIFLVTVGHSFDGLGFTRSYWKGFIYSFHMPLFFAISGFLVAYSMQKIWIEDGRFEAGDVVRFVWKKFQSILIPYFVWLFGVHPLFSNGLSLTISDYQHYWSQYVVHNAGLWFLPCLFFLMCAFAVYLYCIGKMKNRCSCWLDCLFVVCLTGVYYLLLRTTGNDYFRCPMSYMIPFFLGVFVCKWQGMRTAFLHSEWMSFVLLVVFMVSCNLYIWGIEEANYSDKVYRLIADCAAVPLLFRMTYELTKKISPHPGVSWIANNTLIIYVMQNPFIYSCYIKNEQIRLMLPQTIQLCLAVSLSVVVMAICLLASWGIS